MIRYFIELSYNGTNFHGWQIQPNAPTVQETLNNALSTILRENIHVVGAGRTDTGVHASFFVAHFDTNNNIDANFLCHKLNRFLKSDIAIKRIYSVEKEMHARFSAKKRTYHYYINKHKNPFNNTLALTIHYPLNIELMNNAGKILGNYTDFTSFSKLHTDTKTNNCSIYKAEWTETEEQYIFEISANRFLRNMVRAIVGTMIEIGIGKLSLEEFPTIIEAKDRNKAKKSAEPQGLFLSGIEY